MEKSEKVKDTETAPIFAPSVKHQYRDSHLLPPLILSGMPNYRADEFSEADIGPRPHEFIEQAIAEALTNRMDELKQSPGLVHLLHLEGLSLRANALPSVSHLFFNEQLMREGILALDTDMLWLTPKEDVKIFEQGKLDNNYIVFIAQIFRRILISKKLGLGVMDSVGDREDDFKLDVEFNHLIILDERKVLRQEAWNLPLEERFKLNMDRIRDIDAVYIHFSPKEGAKFRELIKIGRKRSRRNDFLRVFGAGPKL